jgi:hypothetical protein
VSPAPLSQLFLIAVLVTCPSEIGADALESIENVAALFANSYSFTTDGICECVDPLFCEFHLLTLTPGKHLWITRGGELWMGFLIALKNCLVDSSVPQGAVIPLCEGLLSVSDLFLTELLIGSDLSKALVNLDRSCKRSLRAELNSAHLLLRTQIFHFFLGAWTFSPFAQLFSDVNYGMDYTLQFLFEKNPLDPILSVLPLAIQYCAGLRHLLGLRVVLETLSRSSEGLDLISKLLAVFIAIFGSQSPTSAKSFVETGLLEVLIRKCREFVDLADNISELHGLGMLLLEVLSPFPDCGSESPMAFHVWKSDLNHVFVDFFRFTGLNQGLLKHLGPLLVNEAVPFSLISSSQLIFNVKPLLVLKSSIADPTVHSDVFACLNRVASSIENCYFLHESG